MKQTCEQNILTRVCLGCALVIVAFRSIQVANSSSVSNSSLNNSDIISLKARINRLEQDVNQLRNQSLTVSSTRPAKKLPISPALPSSRSPVVNPPIVNGRAVGESDPMYERLATLLIELKEDVRNIDERLTKIEQKTTP